MRTHFLQATWKLGLKVDVGLRLGFFDHILGFVKSLDSTRYADHFDNDFDFSSLGLGGLDIGWNEMGCLHR